MKEERIGLLGGTFNPGHLGHIRAAEIVRDRFGLDRVLLIPSAIPPHKEAGDVAPARDRLRMIELACAGRPRLQASDLEVRARGRSYSILTLRRVAGLYPRARVFFILGSDAFAEIDTWRDYEQVLEQCPFIVVSRPGAALGEAARVLGGRLRDRMVVLGPRDVPDESQVRPGRIFLLAIDALDVSSTEIRLRLRQGRPVAGLVPPTVDEYLHQHQLYKETMAHKKPIDPQSPPPGKRGLPREVRLAVKAGQAKKAESPVVLDLRALSAFTDFFVIMHGLSGRQNAALAENIEVELKKAGVRPLGVEGKSHAEWILMDYGFFVVHIFSEDKRGYYGLEKLWGDARRYEY
jgi:nicotinate-nucleotide adenylyltransferase